MKLSWHSIFYCIVGMAIGGAGLFLVQSQAREIPDLTSPFVKQEPVQPTPLNQYTITALANQAFQASEPLAIYKLTATTSEFESYLFSFKTVGRTMSGLINIPTTPQPTKGFPILIMLRGYVPPESYVSGTGTKNAAAVFAKKGYVTIAPDFFGYGESDPELSDSWEARFIKPINVIELLKAIEQYPKLELNYTKMQVADTALTTVVVESAALTTPEPATQDSEIADDMSPPASAFAPATENPLVGRPNQAIMLNPQRIGIWAHSNGGQIALTTLEILNQPIPTTLWAPVTAPFPYSLLFFSDEHDDEGKATRKWIAQFERDYDAFEFSLTQHLDRLQGEIQLHHGTLDDAALKSWSDEFVAKVKTENKSRPANQQIKINYFSYPGADHNLQPGWNTAIQRDVEFFGRKLK